MRVPQRLFYAQKMAVKHGLSITRMLILRFFWTAWTFGMAKQE
ncbi:hypothetical protein N824_18730 [Pedobacter sp. V48]|nr:hypothetical protein N824_18730 [Pedobacter sp. V48]